MEHVPATDQQKMTAGSNSDANSKAKVGFGNENNDNNDRRFRNLYADNNHDYDASLSSSSCGGNNEPS